MAILRYFDESNVQQIRALGRDKFLIGRVEPCHLVIDDDLVSREHARVDRDPDGRYRIRDLGSRNKSFVNGQQINESLLTHGDILRIGQRVIEYVDDTMTEESFDLEFMTPDRVDPPGTKWNKIKTSVALPLARYGELAVLGADAGYPARAEDVASAALARLILVLGADRGMIALRGESNKELRPVAMRGLMARTGSALIPASQTFIYSALLQSVAGRYPQKSGQVDSKAGYAGAGLVAPLLYRDDVVGVVYVDRVAFNNPFPESAHHEIAAAGAHIGSIMADASQRLVSSERTLGPAWLATLRRMQLAMTIPPQGSTAFDVAAKLIAGRMRCGDFCDVMHVGKDRVFVLTVDAGGQGVAGLVHAAAIRTAIRTALAIKDGTRDVAEIVSAVNTTMLARKARQLVTCTLVDIDPAGGQIRYVNAGGPPPLMLVGAGRLVTLDQPSLVLGIDETFGYQTTSVDLPSSFRVICHTDGLPEMTNAAGEALGTQRLHDLLLDQATFGTPGEIITRMVEACEKHRSGALPDDDAMVVVVSHG